MNGLSETCGPPTEVCHNANATNAQNYDWRNSNGQISFRMPVMIPNDFVSVEGTWIADFTETCWDEGAALAEAALAEAISRRVGFAVEVQIFHANGHSIIDRDDEVFSGSVEVQIFHANGHSIIDRADEVFCGSMLVARKYENI